MRNQGRNRRKIRVEGRFYAFLTLLLVLCIGAGVFINTRTSRPESYDPVLATPPPPAVQADPTVPAPAATVIPANPQTDPNALAVPSDPQGADPAGVVIGTESSMDLGLSIDDEPAMAPLDDSQRIQVGSDVSARQDLPPEWHNFLLLGTDSRDMKNISRCDAIIIASVNASTGEIKLVSLMRDMMIEIPGHGMQKLTAATYYGGPALAMKVINENLGMNITEYAVVNFVGLAHVIDILGGVYVDLTVEEQKIVNSHFGAIAIYDGMGVEEFQARWNDMAASTYGHNTLLKGYAAVTFARIREIGSDFDRTRRQRNVITGMMQRVKNANLGQLMQMATSMWGYVDTNVNLVNAVSIATSVLGAGLDMNKIQEIRFPVGEYDGGTRDGVYGLYDIDYAYNRRGLHQFIYGTEFD